MDNLAIVAEGLAKRYRIGARQKKFPTFRDTVAGWCSAPWRGRTAGREEDGELWALRDISFQIRQGEVTGVIGRNGAGKSTLLKLLSRITEPTLGFAEIHGRVGSLLEVGTGFHPELTGRENIYLNGAILGMRRAEIESRFEEIVAFAEIERFLETPVKHYSTGMFMRLAFSVAAHLDPEILLVDEVLAVGDAEFQKKCIGKMGGVARQGRTVLFVSHNMPAVQSLCGRCIVLEAGRLNCAASVEEGIRLYQSGCRNQDAAETQGEVAIANLRVNGSTQPRIEARQPARLEFDIAVRADISGFRLILVVENTSGTLVLHAVRTERNLRRLLVAGAYRVALEVPALHLTPAAYSFYVKFIYNGIDVGGRFVSDKAVIQVAGDYSPDAAPGLLTPPVAWSAAPIAACEPAAAGLTD